MQSMSEEECQRLCKDRGIFVKDFAFRFGVNINENETYFQLKFELENGKNVHMEMTLKQFNDLLNELEKAYNAMK